MAGAMAGWTVCVFITPIEHIKGSLSLPSTFTITLIDPKRNMTAKLQLQTTGPKLYTGPIDCAKQIVRANGVTGLWHGFAATLYFRTGIGALYGSYEMMLRGFRSVPDESRWKISDEAATFIAGGMSSNIFWFVIYPIDAVKK